MIVDCGTCYLVVKRHIEWFDCNLVIVIVVVMVEVKVSIVPSNFHSIAFEKRLLNRCCLDGMDL